MTMMRMPVFVWMMLVVAFLTLFAMPPLTAALIHGLHGPQLPHELLQCGGRRRSAAVPEPVLDLRPPRGVHPDPPGHGRSSPRSCPCSRASRCSATRSWCSPASRSASSVGACGRTTCSRRASARSPTSAFGLSTMLIAIPTGVKIFNWLAHRLGRRRCGCEHRCCSRSASSRSSRSAASRACMHSIVPADTQQTDTYFVVAHFHYVLFGGLVFAIFGGIYYWCPKIFGKHAQREAGQAELLAAW